MADENTAATEAENAEAEETEAEVKPVAKKAARKSVTKKVTVTVKKRFKDAETGKMHFPGETFEATRTRVNKIKSVDAGLVEINE